MGNPSRSQPVHRARRSSFFQADSELVGSDGTRISNGAAQSATEDHRGDGVGASSARGDDHSPP